MQVQLLGMETAVECERIELAGDAIQPVFTRDQALSFLDAWNNEAGDVPEGEYRKGVFYFHSYNELRRFANKADSEGLYRIGATSPEGPWHWNTFGGN